ncbi:MAG: 3-methyl-2-oxobutanoate hydroxymethyltransferase, partial [Elusimicrobiota bacterium]
HVIGDMPIGTYDNPKQAVINAKRFLKVGCDSIKFEGCHADIARAFRENGIPAVGHIGLTPQTADSFKVRGRDKREAARLKKESRILSRQGVILLILECIPWLLGKEISRLIKIPTIGIGAGSYCDGQVLVAADMLGLFTRFKPRFVRRYANLFEEAVKAVERFGKDVKAGRYPSKKESY